MSKIILSIFVLSALLLPALEAQAQSWKDKLRIDLYGNWHYSETDEGNTFNGATADGAYENTELALSLTGELSSSVTVYAQVFWGHEENVGDERESQVELEVAALQWNVADQFGLRFGRSRVPFGVYTELWHAGTARPFNDLPQSLYGEANFVAPFYDGVGITGGVKVGGGWGLTYDAYVGEMSFSFLEPSEAFAAVDGADDGEEEEGERVLGPREVELTDVVGGRFFLETPIPGFRFGASAYRGDVEAGFERGAEDQTVFGLQAEYLSDRWTVRAEYAEAEVDETREGSYLELGYKLTDHWQLAAKYEQLETRAEADEIEELGTFATTLKHEEIALGLNYWVHDNFLLKLSYHRIDGNHLALPVDFFALAEEGTLEALDDRTNLLLFGVSFAF